MLKIVNLHIAEVMPLFNVSSLRHAVEATSRREAHTYIRSHQTAQMGAITAAMAHLSAHSQETSEEVYGGDEALIFSASEEDVDLYRLCGSLYDQAIGIETRKQVPATAAAAESRQHVTPPTAHKVKRVFLATQSLSTAPEVSGGSASVPQDVPMVPQVTGPFAQETSALVAVSASVPAVHSRSFGIFASAFSIPHPKEFFRQCSLGGYGTVAQRPIGNTKSYTATSSSNAPAITAYTLVVLIVPFTTLVEEARRNTGSDDKDSLDPRTLHLELKICFKLLFTCISQESGRLAIASYDTVAKHRPKLQSIGTKGVREILVFDEIQEFINCESNDRFRKFRNVWTLPASLQPAFVLGLTATLRPCDEKFTANACGLTARENVMRASCQRPAVTATCEVYEEEVWRSYSLLSLHCGCDVTSLLSPPRCRFYRRTVVSPGTLLA
jgi:hypothetical protein